MKQWLVILLRSITLLVITLILVRINGKRHTSKLTPFKFVNYSVIAILVSLMSVNVIKNLVFGFIALAVWGIVPIAIDYLSKKSKWVHDWVKGKETILIKNGKVMEENLNQLRMTGEDLMRELRVKNAFNLADVEFAIMEPTGDVNVIMKSSKKPITPYDVEWKVSPQKEPQTVILDGNILNESLANMGLNKDWLNTQLKNIDVALENVFIGQVDTSGDLYIDTFDDSIQIPKPRVKEAVYANIEKSQADLMKYSLETKDKEAKDMYSKDAEILKEVMMSLRPYLLR